MELAAKEYEISKNQSGSIKYLQNFQEIPFFKERNVFKKNDEKTVRNDYALSFYFVFVSLCPMQISIEASIFVHQLFAFKIDLSNS